LPPLLPTVFTVSVGVSDGRLASKRIATVIAENILIAGKVKIAFFDKTGTLTKQGLDFLGTRSAVTWNAPSKDISDNLMIAMTTCHSLTMAQDGSVIGTPLDRSMFAVSGGKIGPDASIITDKGEQFTVVRHFDFDHQRMSQSVVLEYPDGTYAAFVKGSGESIQKMCVAKSIPADFASVLHESSKKGIYQISFASKILASKSVHSLTRNEVESDLNFVGVMDFKNVIREDTPGVIAELTNGDVRSIIVTGDSVLAGVRVAKECGIMSQHKPVFIAGTNSKGGLTWSDYDGNPVEMPLTEGAQPEPFDLAISGRAWKILCSEHPNVVASLAPFASVFGRLTPQDKVSVIRTYNDLGFVTLMAGDGGNDVGALKTAHVGVAMSDNEASMVAPFTSLDKTITAVVDVVKEGRCALASALATYKFMIMFGQVETNIQLIAAYFQITPCEFCWLFMDGIWYVL
jgi:magnesium-transporting ATPase (P-type)